MIKSSLKKVPKKSETLEVRISHDKKQELSARAKIEGRTVSDVVRNLIDTYLANPASGTETSIFGDTAMRLKYFFKQKPKTVFAGLAGVFASSLLFLPIAHAEPFILDVKGEYVQFDYEEEGGTRTRRFNTEVELDFGSSIIMTLDGQSVSNATSVTEDGMWIKVTVEEAALARGEKGVLILFSIINKTDETETVLAEPVLTAAYDETAAFITETQSEKYSFKFLPRGR